jgi:cell wall-associated NlpC family hydrolase
VSHTGCERLDEAGEDGTVSTMRAHHTPTVASTTRRRIAGVLMVLLALGAARPAAADDTELDAEEILTQVIEVRDPAELDPKDPAYPVMLRLYELRADAQHSVEAAEAAEAEAEQAERQAALAAFGATVAGARAEHAQGVLNRWAASLWRGETGEGDAVSALNVSLANPALAVDVREWLDVVSKTKRADVATADELEVKADQELAAAAASSANAERLREEAEIERALARKKLTDAERTVEQLLGQTVSRQMLIGGDGCPVEVPDDVLRGAARRLDVEDLCKRSVEQAATPEAALAIKYAFRALGAPYACEGVGRWQPFLYDCSSLVMRAYASGAGLATVVPGFLPNTRDLIPWDGHALVPWVSEVAVEDRRPGDLVFYDTFREDSRHVVMILVDGLMLHTGKCGDVAHIIDLWGTEPTEKYVYLLTRRVVPDLARHQGDLFLDPETVLDGGTPDPGTGTWQGDGVDPETGNS